MQPDKNYWENIYRTKGPASLSCRLIDYLLDEGYTDLTVLDISGAALQKARQRLGERANLVKWIEQDITQFQPARAYDLWHDRATFHFLTTAPQVSQYLISARVALPLGGYFVIATFSDNGPEKCSGLPIHQYSEKELTQALTNGFSKIRCITEDHITPFNTTQNFLFCSFKRA